MTAGGVFGEGSIEDQKAIWKQASSVLDKWSGLRREGELV